MAYKRPASYFYTLRPMKPKQPSIPGAEIRARRIAMGLTQRELALELGLAPNSVARLERESMRVSHPILMRAALFLIEDRHRAQRLMRTARGGKGRIDTGAAGE